MVSEKCYKLAFLVKPHLYNFVGIYDRTSVRPRGRPMKIWSEVVEKGCQI